MNYSQLTGIFRIFLPVLIGIATKYVGADTVNTVGSILAAAVAAGGWSAAANSSSGLAQNLVSAAPGVKVQVPSSATPALQKLASDPTVPAIVHADPVEYSPGVYGTARRRE